MRNVNDDIPLSLLQYGSYNGANFTCNVENTSSSSGILSFTLLAIFIVTVLSSAYLAILHKTGKKNIFQSFSKLWPTQFPLIPLYTRLRRDRLLNNSTRKNIVVHLKDRKTRLLGSPEGQVDMKQCARALADIGYDKWLVLETSGRQDQFLEDTRANVAWAKETFGVE